MRVILQCNRYIKWSICCKRYGLCP